MKKETPTQNYVIKHKAKYLHIVGDEEDLQFKDKKAGSATFKSEDADLVIKTLNDGGSKHIFKSKIKDKDVYERPKKTMENWRKKRVRKQLEKDRGENGNS